MFGFLGMPLCGYRYVHGYCHVLGIYTFKKLFLWAASASQIVCVNFEPLKLTKVYYHSWRYWKNTQKCNKFGLVGSTPGELSPRALYFLKLPLSCMLSCLTRNPVTYHFRDIRVKWQKIGTWETIVRWKKLWQYVESFRYNTGTWQTNKRTDSQTIAIQ